MVNLINFAAASCTPPKGNPFFGFPHWWQYLGGVSDSVTGTCMPTFSGINDAWAVGLAIVEILLRVAGLVAIISIIASGAQYIFSGGNPEKAASARRRIYNSLIGLAIAVVTTALVAYIGVHFQK